jgi:hypothetical protein|tara:strand:- start:512 stop:643 length:132 start_codon:yes stop_codon:yes gene_type:complete
MFLVSSKRAEVLDVSLRRGPRVADVVGVDLLAPEVVGVVAGGA